MNTNNLIIGSFLAGFFGTQLLIKRELHDITAMGRIDGRLYRYYVVMYHLPVIFNYFNFILLALY